MKKLVNTTLIAFFMLGVLNNVFSQKNTQYKAPEMPIDSITKLITYTNVIHVRGETKTVLYNRALNWFNTFYKNPTEVIREKNENQIVGKARFKIMNPPPEKGTQTQAGVVQYTFKTFFKDGRYKYEITNINWKQTSYYPIEKWMDKESVSYVPKYDYYLKQVDDYIKDTISKFVTSMKKAPAKKKDDFDF